MDGFKILEIAHRTAWKYKKSSDSHHSDTYTFNEFTMIDFAQKVTREMEIRIQALEHALGVVMYEVEDDDFTTGRERDTYALKVLRDES